MDHCVPTISPTAAHCKAVRHTEGEKRFWKSVASYGQYLPWNAYLANNTTIFCLSFRLISDYCVFVHLKTGSLLSVASVLHLLTGLLFSTAPSINKGLDAAARAGALQGGPSFVYLFSAIF